MNTDASSIRSAGSPRARGRENDESWRRFIDATVRQELNVDEIIEAFANDGNYLNYADFMRGLVSVLGSGCRQFSHLERKKLFDSLKPNRDSLIEIEAFRRKLKTYDKSVRSPSSSGSPRSATSPFLHSLYGQESTSAREAVLQYRRERLLNANLIFRAALLDRRPLLCCRLATAEATTIVAESTLIFHKFKTEINASLLWNHQTANATLFQELRLPTISVLYGLSGTIISYGDANEQSFLFGTEGLLWTVIRFITAEIKALEGLAQADPIEKSCYQPPCLELAFTQDESIDTVWTKLSAHSSESEKDTFATMMTTSKVARLRLVFPYEDKIPTELRLLAVSTNQVSSIDIDNHQAWFTERQNGVTNVLSRVYSSQVKHRPLSTFAQCDRDQAFVYLVCHVSEPTCAKQLAALANQRVAACPSLHFASRNTFEPPLSLELLRQQRVLSQQQKQQQTDERIRCQHTETSVNVNDLIRECAQRLEHLDERSDIKLEHPAVLAKASRRQQLMAWERASRLQAALGRIQVVCRIRPLLPAIDEKLGPPPEVRQRLKTKKCRFVHRSGAKGRHVTLQLDGHKLPQKCRAFEFDDVWDEATTQNGVFESVENIANDVLAGCTATIFAYGCSGAGKTYTVVGDLRSEPPQLGIAFQSVELLLATLRGKGKGILISMVEVHNEEVYDLLKPRDAIADVVHSSTPRHNAFKNTEFTSAKAENSQQSPRNRLLFTDETGSVHDSEESYGSYATSRFSSSSMYTRKSPKSNSRRDSDPRKRAHPSPWSQKHNYKKRLEIRLNGDVPQLPELTKVDIDNMNIFLKVFEAGNRRRVTKSTLLNDHSSRSHVIVTVETASGGRLCLVDLAGCERVNKSGSHGDALKEATCINKSLSALGDCFEAIDRKRSHIPYRNSKLTFLLSDVIGGSASRCLFVFAASPAWATLPETLSSFKFAARLSTIQLSGEALSEKMKHVDACLAVAAERSERALLAAFLSELQAEEQQSLIEATKRVAAEKFTKLAEGASFVMKSELIEPSMSNENAFTNQEDDVVTKFSTTPCDGIPINESLSISPLSAQSERDQRVELEIKMLWDRLSATEAELAALKEVEEELPPAPLEPEIIEHMLAVSPVSREKSTDASSEKYASKDEDDYEGTENVGPDPPPLDDEDTLSVIQVCKDGERHFKDINVELIIQEETRESNSGCGVDFFDSIFGSDDDESGGQQLILPKAQGSHTSGHHKLVIALHQAEGLLPDTSMGPLRSATNPYVVVRYGDEEHLTEQDTNTLSPIWDADLIFNFVEQNPTYATLYLFAKNSYTPDSLLGKCVLNFRKPTGQDAQKASKPQVLLERMWLPIAPCCEQERDRLRHFVRFDKKFLYVI